jgi:hypothetical protein
MILLKCIYCDKLMNYRDFKNKTKSFSCKDLIKNKTLQQEIYLRENDDCGDSYYIDFIHNNLILTLHGSQISNFTMIYDKDKSSFYTDEDQYSLIKINEFKELDLLNLKQSIDKIKDLLLKMAIFK